MVDLDQPWLEITIDHHIESEDLETKLIFNIIGLACPKNMPECGHARDHGLHNEIVDLVLKFVDIAASHLEIFHDLFITTLVCFALTILVIVLLELT